MHGKSQEKHLHYDDSLSDRYGLSASENDSLFGAFCVLSAYSRHFRLRKN